MTTFDKVKDIIVDSLSCDEEQVTLEASLRMILKLIHWTPLN